MPETASIFPLKLTPMEHYFWADDRPDYPMTFWIHLKFSGVIDRSLFEKALKNCQKNHPLITARVQGRVGQRTSQLFWVNGEDFNLPICWEKQEDPLPWTREKPIQLSREPGIRIFIRKTENNTELFLQGHHSIFDGTGIYHFFCELFAHYNNLYNSNSHPIPIPILNEKILSDRSQFYSKPNGRIKKSIYSARVLKNFWFHRVRPLTSNREISPSGRGEGNYPPFLSHLLPKSDLDTLKSISKRVGVTLNDLLLWELFLSLDQWNQQFGPNGKNRNIRIYAPINVRPLLKKPMLTTCVLGAAYVDVKARAFKSPRQILNQINRTMGAIKNWNLGTVQNSFFHLFGKIHGGIKFIMGLRRCFATAVFSNLGELLGDSTFPKKENKVVFGNILLEKIEGYPPLRSGTSVSFTALSYGGPLSLCLHYDKKVFNPSQGKQLLQNLVERIGKTIQSSK